MKRLYLFLSAFLFSFMCYAQKIHLGIMCGLNTSKESTQIYNSVNYGSFDYDTYSRHGINVGGLINIPTGKKLELEAGISYSMLGYKDRIYKAELQDAYFYAKVTSHYLTIPVAEKYYPFGDGIYIELGPQVGFLLSKKASLNDVGYIQYKGNNNILDFAVLGGLGYRFQNNVFVDVRYIHSFTETCKLYGGGKNRNFQISLGFLF